MASAWPFPCRLKDTDTGDFYYFDGVNPPTIMTGGVGSDLNNALGNVGSFLVTTAQRQNIEAYFLGRLRAFAAIAACETCPTGSPAAKADPGDPHDTDDRRTDDEVQASVLAFLAGGDGAT